MTDWKKKMAAQLSSGEKPSYDDLEEALQGALEERNQLARLVDELDDSRNILLHSVTDMTGWLGKIAAAFIQGDASKLADIVNEFVKKRVNLNEIPHNKKKH